MNVSVYVDRTRLKTEYQLISTGKLHSYENKEFTDETTLTRNSSLSFLAQYVSDGPYKIKKVLMKFALLKQFLVKTLLNIAYFQIIEFSSEVGG